MSRLLNLFRVLWWKMFPSQNSLMLPYINPRKKQKQ
jgi:hypothetical protein